MSGEGLAGTQKGFFGVTADLVKFQISLGNILQIIITVIGLVGLLYQEGQNQQRTQDRISSMQDGVNEMKQSLVGLFSTQNSEQLGLTQVNDDLKMYSRLMDSYEKHLESDDSKISALDTEVRALDTSLQILSNSLKNQQNNHK